MALHPPEGGSRIDAMKKVTLGGLRRGFTIIELMIVVVVAAVLLAIAYPSYQSSIRKSRRVDAFNALSEVQQRQERHRSTLPAFTDLLTTATTATPPGLGLPAVSANGYYNVAITLTGGTESTRYVAAATAVSGTTQAADGPCAVLAIRMDGGNLRYGAGATLAAIDWTAANVDPQRCWAR